jgi:hypothetical protein
MNGADTDGFIQTQASRFATERGYQASLVAVGKALLQQQNLQSQDCAKIILPSPDGRAHVNTAKKLGFQDAQIQNPLFKILAQERRAVFLLALLWKQRNLRASLASAYGEGADGLLRRSLTRFANARLRVHCPNISARNVCILRIRSSKKCVHTTQKTKKD